MGATVLVVDDERDLREALSEVLREEGFVVREASNGIEALDEIERFTPDVLLLDLMMPVMDGWAVLSVLRQRREHIPTIVLSALTPDGDVDQVKKPVSLERLLALIEVLRARSSGAFRVA